MHRSTEEGTRHAGRLQPEGGPLGREATCDARLNRRTLHGRALLETAELIFRGEASLKIPFRDMKDVEAISGRLRIRFGGGVLFLKLGPAAEAWARAIRSPRSLADKLGLRPGARVFVRGLHDPGLLSEIRSRTVELATGRPRKGLELVFLGARVPSDLGPLRSLRSRLAPAGALWVVWPKGQKGLREDDIRARALACGLVDVKVASISESLSGLKLVIPLSQRARPKTV